MKRKIKVFSVILCLLIAFSSIFSIISINASAQTKYEYNYMNSETSDTNVTNYIYLENEQTHFLPNENIIVSFLVYSDENIIDYEYSSNGFNVISINIDESNIRRIVVELSCDTNLSEFIFDLTVFFEGGDTSVGSMFAICNEYGVFTSPFSTDNALERYCQYAIQNNILTEEEAYRVFIQKYSNIVEETITTELNSSITEFPSGTMSTGTETAVYNCSFEWTDDKGDTHPLRNVKVEVCSKVLDIISVPTTTIHTDDEGSCQFSVPVGTHVILKIYAGDSNAMVKSGLLFSPYCSELDLANYKDNVANNIEYDPFPVENDFGKALQISQAILTARDYAAVMMGETPSNVSIIYPHDGEIEEAHDSTNTNGCYYKSLIKTIHITGRHPNSDALPHTYADWDVIMHEYGHHIQQELDMNDSPGGGHDSLISMAEHYKDHYLKNDFKNCKESCAIQNKANLPSLIVQESDCKYKGCAIAWAEAWATVFGNVAQEYYADILTNIDFVCDAQYTAFNGANYSLEATRIINENNLAEDVEGLIICFLYDMYDNKITSESFDNLSLSDEAMWSLFVDSEANTLFEFIEYIKSLPNYKSRLSDIGKLLNEYDLSTELPTLSGLGFDCPTVEFTWDEPNDTRFFNARKFSVNFYDSSYNLIGSTTPQVLSPDSSKTYRITISEALWQSVLNLDSTFYISVTVWEYDGNINNTGDGYYITHYDSEYAKYSISNLYQRIYYNYGLYETLEEGDFYWFKFIAPMTDEYIFEATGGADTYGELFTDLAVGRSTTNRIAYNDDSGEDNNFRITYCLNKGDVVYLRIRGFDWIETGSFTVTVTSVNHTHDYSYSYSDYSATMHKCNCICGGYIYENHDFVSGLGMRMCRYCGYSTQGNKPTINSIDNEIIEAYNNFYFIPNEEND